MKKGLFILLCLLSQTAYCQPSILWDKEYGGSRQDVLNVLLPTTEGGFMLAGHSRSIVGYEKTVPPRGEEDYWIIKIDSLGEIVWDTAYGGSLPDKLQAMIAVPGGGWLLGGTSVSPAGGDKSEKNFDKKGDYWVVRIDEAGNKLWDKTFGGSAEDDLYALAVTASGGFLIGGSSGSPADGNKTAPNLGVNGVINYWVVCVDSSGNKLWDKAYGGDGFEDLRAMVPSPDGGFLLGGGAWYGLPNGDFSEANRGLWDYWLLRIDSAGNKVWDKTYGGKDDDILYLITPLDNGDYLLGGTSKSDIGFEKSENSRGIKNNDFWLIRIDSTGNLLWDKTFGGNGGEELRAITPVLGGGFLLAGYTTSTGTGKDDVSTPTHGYRDYWVMCMDKNRRKVWDKTIGGADHDYLLGAAMTEDGGHLLAGWSQSNKSGDKSEDCREVLSLPDYWLVRLSADSSLMTIHTQAPDRPSYCQGDTLSISFSVDTVFASDNTFKVLLSDPVKAFSKPLIIGTVNSVKDTTIRAVLPSNLSPGTHYRIQIVSTNPEGEGRRLPLSVNALPSKPVLSHNGDTLVSSATSGNQWYNGKGLIPGATSDTFVPKTNDIYYVVVTQGHCSSNSDTVEFTSRTPHVPALATLYPNPADETIAINSAQAADAEVLRLDGTRVWQGQIPVLLSVSQWAEGVYMCRIRTADGRTATLKLFVVH